MFRMFAVSLALAAMPAAAQAVQFNVVQESLELNPADIETVKVVQDQGQWAISIKLAPGARAMFGAVTGRSIGKRMQIVVADRILSAPVVRNAIMQGEVWITGTLTEDEARALAAKIKR